MTIAQAGFPLATMVQAGGDQQTGSPSHALADRLSVQIADTDPLAPLGAAKVTFQLSASPNGQQGASFATNAVVTSLTVNADVGGTATDSVTGVRVQETVNVIVPVIPNPLSKPDPVKLKPFGVNCAVPDSAGMVSAKL